MEKKEETRSFKGKTSNFKDKQERTFEQKRLKGYLRGNKYFQYGSNWITMFSRQPTYYSVETGELMLNV